MDLAKQAVAYYVTVTGNEWSQFYTDLDKAMSGVLEEQTGEDWLIHSLMNTVVRNGVTVEQFKMSKDAIKALFDEDARKLAGEFFTPVVWAEELHRYIDKYEPNWRQSHLVWENSCYDIDTKVIIRRHFDKWSDIVEQVRANEDLSNGLICMGDRYSLDKSEAPSFNHLDWLYDTGYTYIGRINAHSLLPDDEILTCNPDNPYKEFTWCGYHNLFFKTSNEMISFRFGDEVFDFETRLKVTSDHKMFIYMMIDGSLMAITADELCKLLDNGDEVYIWGRDENRYKVSEYKRWNIEREVWDLTTDNDTHCFCVSVMNGNNDSKYIDIFSGNCGSGNLIRTAGVKPDNLYGSTLQQDDVDFLNNTPELQGAHIFQMDFLNYYDTKTLEEFTDNLPDRLKNAIKNDEPIIFLCNPPYKSGQANTTNVGKYMGHNIPYFNDICFAKPAYDLFYQFCFQVMNIAALHKLTNCYYAVFGPLTWFTGAGANILLKEFERTFEFLDGMCISAQEFSDTSESILWGISATLWKSRGGYVADQSINCHKDILLDKKFIAPDGTIGNEGKVLYAPPRKKLSTWVHEEDKHVGKTEYPLMTSHLTFKGGDVYEKVAHKMVKARNDLWGILMSQDTMTRSSDQSAVMSMPSSIQYEPIVRENFWRAVASYTFRRVYEADWSIAKKDISSPDTTVEGYDIWLKNAIPVFLFEYKSMMSSLRGVVPAGELDYDESQQTKITIRNNFFFLTPDEVREHCTDPVILKDLEENPPTEGQEFMLQVIKECEPYWVPEVRQLYDWCKAYTLATYDMRKTVNYNGSLECWDAGFQQLRSALWNPDKLNDDMTKLLVQARDFLRKDIMKFGFVTEVQSNEDL